MKATLPGKILRIMVKEGEKVKEGDVLAVIDSMKLENDMTAEKEGRVKAILVKEGDIVQIGQEIIIIE